MDLLNTLNSVAPAPTKVIDISVKSQKIDVSKLQTKEVKKIEENPNKSRPNNELMKKESKENPVQFYNDTHGNTHMIVEKKDPLQTFGKFKKLPTNTSQPIRIDHKSIVNKEELKKWNIPPCVSNYKNPQGFVIPLDKRMAHQHKKETKMNENFGKMAEALYEADHKLKERLNQRRIQEQKALKQQQLFIEHSLEVLTKDKKVVVGDKRDYEEFQQEQLEHRLRKKKRDDVPSEFQFDSRMTSHKEADDDEPVVNTEALMNKAIQFEKSK
eukprot:NODE_34_length_36538_cov_0.612854.p15 type:complete len:270 gc:universal NODE_34_length_36538_cov_0.612854:24674-23865(-)